MLAYCSIACLNFPHFVSPGVRVLPARADTCAREDIVHSVGLTLPTVLRKGLYRCIKDAYQPFDEISPGREILNGSGGGWRVDHECGTEVRPLVKLPVAICWQYVTVE